MEPTVLRPKPMPGQEPGGAARRGPVRRPSPEQPRRGRRLAAVASVLLAGLILLLAGIGLGTVGATLIGLRLAGG
ncbi:hypothetical protein [Streptomyces sp. NPDC018610]|uniref:hypothetical protein n=1 Tax=Streptomyces sp. NPDC018610 TaxID=3365049 RepID=UPI0037B7C7DE